MRSVGLTEETSPFNPHRQQYEGAPLALLLLIAGEIHLGGDLALPARTRLDWRPPGDSGRSLWCAQR